MAPAGDDTRSVSDSVESHGSARSSGSNKSQKQASRLWLDKGSFWEGLVPVDLQDGSTRLLEQISWDLKAAKEVIKDHPKILVLPILCTLLFLVASVVGVLVAADITQDAQMEERESFQLKERVAVEAATNKMKDGLEDGLERAAMPLRMVELHVQKYPEYPYMEENFLEIAETIMKVANLPGDAYALGLDPFGKVAVKYPAEGNAGAIGHDNMMHCQVVQEDKKNVTTPGSCTFEANEFAEACTPEGLGNPEYGCYPSRRYITYLSVKLKTLTVDGPVNLVQGGEKFILRHPIFVNTTDQTYNDTFGRSYGPSNCTTDCYDATTGMRYWGMSDSMLTFSRWLELARVEELAADAKLAYRIMDPGKNHTLKTNVENVLEPLVTEVRVYNRVLQLETSPIGDWIKPYNVESEMPGWRDPLLALGVVFSCLLGLALLGMLVNKRRHQMLLHSMLPVKTLPYVETGRNFCEQFSNVTILFSDIVSYTNLAEGMSPLEVVNLLNDLYFMFDNLVEKNNVYKVETIGDAFMCAGGVPNRLSPMEGASSVADMALDMIKATSTFVSKGGIRVRIRIGMHSGACVGAVTGLKMPHYCLYGDTVNVASRMESNSEVMRCHISSTTFQLLKSSQKEYKLKPRGEVNVKGKGPMFTYWLDLLDESVDSLLKLESAGGQRVQLPMIKITVAEGDEGQEE